MDLPAIESAGGIKLPKSGHYVVHLENLSEVIDAALSASAKISVIGKTSSNAGAAFIVAVDSLDGSEKSSQDMFVGLPNAAGMSAALMDVISRRS